MQKMREQNNKREETERMVNTFKREQRVKIEQRDKKINNIYREHIDRELTYIPEIIARTERTQRLLKRKTKIQIKK